jgi:rhodanese-related sulfurtransferase
MFLPAFVLAAALAQSVEANSYITVEELEASLTREVPPVVLDVRRPLDFDADPRVIPTAEWRNPERVDEWGKELSREREVVVYCVRGAQVSKDVAARLGEMGFHVSNLEGGIAAWKRAGGVVVPRKR